MAGIREKTARIVPLSFSNYLEVLCTVLSKKYNLILIGMSMGGCIVGRVSGMIGIYHDFVLNQNSKQNNIVINNLNTNEKINEKKEIPFSENDHTRILHQHVIDHEMIYSKFYDSVKFSISLCTALDWKDVFDEFEHRKLVFKSQYTSFFTLLKRYSLPFLRPISFIFKKLKLKVLERHIINSYLQYLKINNLDAKLKRFLKDYTKINSLKQLNTLIALHNNNLDVEEYYHRNSIINFINFIKIPFLMLNTEDDILIPSILKKRNELEKLINNENIIICEIASGGHLGMIDNYWECYADNLLKKIIKNVVENIMNNKKEYKINKVNSA